MNALFDARLDPGIRMSEADIAHWTRAVALEEEARKHGKHH